ncbi:ABC transporter substrate-binding protein [Streptomyces tauricus]|uniref:ABC transporter substrate-binding protein n=1 Tax=Streptomyces tauricus TaxID=68274 RepID=UPI002242C998|nr:ABC transporter substrate-binding protein [Streptomyces tauricus]MCW8102210.1 ABC transporter substrate-binding protein [Streptomyces tauricus]
MSETIGSYVNEAHGSVHSGTGPQFNLSFHLRAAEARLRERAGRRRLAIAKGDRIHLDQRFVAPPRLQRAREELRRSRTVLVDGLPGSGRRTAALMLLHELSESRGSLHELPDTADDRTASPLDTQDINDGDRLLLDLSEADESRYVAVQQVLSDFRSSLLGHDAHLAVVLPHHLGYLLQSDLRRFTVEIGRPSAKRVLARHLRCEDIVPSAEELSGRKLADYLSQAPLRDVAELADRIKHGRNTAGTEGGFSDWLSASLDRQQDQSARVAADTATEQGGRRRALMLSLAMFHGTTPGAVLQATNALLNVLSHPPDPAPRLDRADLHAEFGGIGAETGPDGRVRFRRTGYDSAVREHFWTFMPDIRRQLRDWFRACLAEPALTQPDRSQGVARFAEQSLRTGRPEDLAWLAQQWTQRGARAHLVADAAQALALGLDDDRHGRSFRQQIYEWAKSAETSTGLREVLIVVCSEAMARSHPDQALVRLHHLARRTQGPTGVRAREALSRLARSDHRLYRQMLDRLAAGITHKQWTADIDLFLAVTEPVWLVGSRRVRESLIVCWNAALRRPVDTWSSSVCQWLDACADHRHRGCVLEVLVAACAADSRVSGQLYRVSLGWQRTDARQHTDARQAEVREDIVGCLLRQINAAQGIEPYEHP